MSKLTLNQLKEKFIGKKGTAERIKFEADVQSVLNKVEENVLVDLAIIPDNLIPPVVYKYSPWKNEKSKEHTKKLITHKEIYMASPADFHAAYPECRLPRRYDLVRDEDAFIKCYVIHEIFIGNCLQPTLKRDFIKLFKHVKQTLKNPPQQAEDEILDERYKGFGVFCTCESKNNTHLWNNFGDSFKGYCVGLNTSELLKHRNFLGLCGAINYYNPKNPPVILPIYPFYEDVDYGAKSITTEIFSIPKKGSLEEEKEYRFFKSNSVNGKMCNYSDEDRGKILPESAFFEIIIGYQMNEQNKKELLEHANKTMPNVPIFEATDVESNVEFTQIKCK